MLQSLPSLYIDSKEKDTTNENECFINNIICNSIPKAITFSQLLSASRSDTTLIKIGECLKTGKWNINDEDITPYIKVKG